MHSVLEESCKVHMNSAKAWLAIAKDVKKQQLVSSLLTGIHGSFEHTIPVLCQDLATRDSYELKPSYVTLLGAHCVVLSEVVFGTS